MPDKMTDAEIAERPNRWRWVCRLWFHNWQFMGIKPIPTGAFVKCKRCGKEGYQSWL